MLEKLAKFSRWLFLLRPVQQVFDILSLCLHTSLSSATHLSVTQPSTFAKSCSIFCLSEWISTSSAAYSATLQTKHLIILFFCSRFILPVNNILSSINAFFAISILLWILLCNIHPLILSYLSICTGSLVPLFVHQHTHIQYLPFCLRISSSSFFHINLHIKFWWPHSGYPLFVVTLSDW